MNNSKDSKPAVSGQNAAYGNPFQPVLNDFQMQQLAAGHGNFALHNLSQGGTFNPLSNQLIGPAYPTPGYQTPSEPGTVHTPIGLVKKIGLNSPMPTGWRVLKYGQGQQIKPQLNKLLSSWSIGAFDYGKLDGSGYGNQFHTSYGSECGQRFIIKTQQ